MQSDAYTLSPGGENLDTVLSEVERTGTYAGLEKNDAMILRLLAEEMVGTVRGVLSQVGGEVWIETSGREFVLHLQARAEITAEEKEQLISVSGSGKNAASRGILGRIGSVFESFLIYGNESALSYPGLLPGPGSVGWYDPAFTQMWSMRTYNEAIEEDRRRQEWDGLEKSILLHMADDVMVGVKSRKVELVVKKKF